ncbi:MAG: ATP-dependent DNA helicase RecG [Erysipelotrichaceae bacterium]|nr:ATP-dependent DNA helicase RecG [Erysipelotrichaceae bacterium]
MDKITPLKKKLLNKMNLFSFNDVLKYFPKRYDDTNLDLYLSVYHDKQNITIEAEVVDLPTSFRIRANLVKIDFKIRHNDEILNVVCFNRKYLTSSLKINQKVLIQGKYNHRKREITLTNILFDTLKKDKLIPIYNTTEGLSSNEFSKIVKMSFEVAEKYQILSEIIPSSLSSKYKLISRFDAYYYRHFPRNEHDINQVNRYFKYEELLIYALTLLYNKKIVKENGKGQGKNIDLSKVNAFTLSIPYNLTKDQKNVIEEIIYDMNSNSNMYRLLQGDVGTGKTIVSTTSLVAVCASSYQGALMAPTDILARQHYKTITSLLEKFPYRVALLVSGLSSKEKKEVKEKIKNHEVDIIVGTHALIQDDVEFNNLGLVVIDEQHRFGVVQRNKLRKKGTNVDFLLMSATPIPRTMALSIFGDMDISTLREFPNGMRKIATRLEHNKDFISVLEEIDYMLEKGSKMYVVCPLIDNDSSSVEKIYQLLEDHYQNRFKVLFLHGKMSSLEKEDIISRFNREKEVKVLVSTTVIEVGIDVKEADIMLILGAERFGLAQIHQLRGRIGRAGNSGLCVLFTEMEEEKERLQFMCECNDGFEISSYDLKRRGPGDIVGSKQSGMVELEHASLIDDYRILEVAREDAKMIIKDFENPNYQKIVKYMLDSYNSSSVSID